MKILFVGKKFDKYAEEASDYLLRAFPESEIFFVSRGDKIPEKIINWSGDYVFSYLSPWIIPKKILQSAERHCINWHPGPPEYPGIGCTNFAIYNREKFFGITCHHMLEKVDTGSIIEVRRFPVLDTDSVYSITQKCYSSIICSFYDIVDTIRAGKKIPKSDLVWTKKPYTRKELNSLSKIDLNMTIEESERRIKATTYDKPWAFVEVNGRKYVLENNEDG